MSAAVFLASRTYTVASANQNAIAPASNLARPQIGLVWRSAGLTGVAMTMNVAGGAFDTVALLDSNLRPGDTVTLKSGATQAQADGSSPVINHTVSAWSGTPPIHGALTLINLDSPVAGPWLRIEITSTGNPAGFVQAGRLLVGSRLECAGMASGAELTHEDTSQIEAGLGWEAITRGGARPVRTGLKLTLPNLDVNDYWTVWHRWFAAVGNHTDILAVPNHVGQHLQVRALHGRIAGPPKVTMPSVTGVNVELSLLSVR